MNISERLHQWGDALGLAWRRAWAGFANARRRAGKAHLPDYVVITLDQPLVDLSPTQPWWERYIPGIPPRQSLATLERALRAVADDPDVRGVLFLCKGLTLQRSHAENLAALFRRFHAWDRAANPDKPAKTLHMHLEQVGASVYVAACAADRIYVTPLTTGEVIGLRVEAEYYRDTLARLGVRAEVVKVAPWKTAADMFAEAGMTPAARDQYDWLLDSFYRTMVDAIAAGRGLYAEQVRALIDGAPLSADAALAAGLVDAILYEDELPAHLAALPAKEGETPKPARLKRYARVDRLLYRRVRPRTPHAVGLLDLTGSIMPGHSRSFPIPLPLLGEATLGSTSVQQAVRAARKRTDLAAVVAYVDSPGGSALASDLMWRELRLLAQEKPLVISMGPVAASGGYYVATPGAWVMAQAGTLTGSIGVITAKVVTDGAYDRLSVGRDSVQRGANADLYSSDHGWSEAQRAQVESGVQMIYTTFQQRVAEGRKLSMEAVAAVAGGRVWTGAQALERGLVDALGDLPAALSKAATLAGMAVGPDIDLRVVRLETGRGRLLAEPVKAAQTVQAALALLGRGGVLPAPAALLNDLLRGDRIWLLADDLPRTDGM